MTIRTDGNKVSYRIYNIFFPDFTHRNDMMDMDLIRIFRPIFLTKVKTTYLARNIAVQLQIVLLAL